MGAARILVVDDEPVVLNVVGSMLKRLGGHEVFSAAGGRQALEIVRNQPPLDIVLSDIDMPETRGLELVREIRLISPGTSAVLMTGGLAHSAEIPPEIPLLAKPFSARRLLDTVRKVLETSEQAGADLVRQCERAAALRYANGELVSNLRSAIEASAEGVRKSQQVRQKARR